MPQKNKSAEVAKKKLAYQNKKKKLAKKLAKKKISQKKTGKWGKNKKVSKKIGSLKLAKKKNWQISKKKTGKKIGSHFCQLPHFRTPQLYQNLKSRKNMDEPFFCIKNLLVYTRIKFSIFEKKN